MTSSGSSSTQIPIDESYTQSTIDDAATFSSGRTIATAAYMVRRENGRTYHSYRDGEYWQPNDQRHQEHERVLHHICLLTLRDRSFLAPIGDNPQHILDVGTGTGLWACDVADQFPSATVTGTDLSPITVTGMQPPNVTFDLDDCTSEWIHPANHFDLIHVRGLVGSVADWPAFYAQAYRHLKPGGYIEQLEWSVHTHCMSSDGRPLATDEVLGAWAANFVDVGRRTGKTFEIAETMTGHIRRAGFEDVVEKRYKWPIGEWSSDERLKEIGRLNSRNWRDGVEGWAMAVYTRVLKWSYDDVQAWLKKVRERLEDPERHIYHEVRIVYARKPEQTAEH